MVAGMAVTMATVVATTGSSDCRHHPHHHHHLHLSLLLTSSIILTSWVIVGWLVIHWLVGRADDPHLQQDEFLLLGLTEERVPPLPPQLLPSPLEWGLR